VDRADVVRRSGLGWAVFSEKTGKRLSRRYQSKRAAAKRLGQIEWFKAHPHQDSFDVRLHSGRIVHCDASTRRPRKGRQMLPPLRIEEQYAARLVRMLMGWVRAAYKDVLREVPKLAEKRKERFDYDPDEPRDESGRWTGAGGSEKRAFVERLSGGLAKITENGVKFQTGVPVKFRALHNTEKAPKTGQYGQDIEPHGRYMLHGPGKDTPPPGWEVDTVKFKSPLVIPLSGKTGPLYGPEGWKARLHEATGKTGAALTKHLRDLGFDGIVTVDKYGTSEIVSLAPPQKRTDSPESHKAQKLIDGAASDLRKATNKPQIAAVAKQFAEQTDTFQRRQLHDQLHDAIGIDPDSIDDIDTVERIDDFVRENVGLISRIPSDLHDDLQELVLEAVRNGRPSDELREDIEERFGVAERHARLIARDQIGKLYADVNHHRQRKLGIRRFVWRTVRDERVRGNPDGKYPNALPSHYDLEGQIFSYDDPPQPEGADEPILPGEDYQCRCYAEPVLDDILGDDDEDEGDDEDTLVDPGEEDTDIGATLLGNDEDLADDLVGDTDLDEDQVDDTVQDEDQE